MSIRAALTELRVKEAMASTKSEVLQNLNLYQMVVEGDLGDCAQDAMIHTLQACEEKIGSVSMNAASGIADSIDTLLSDGWQSGLDENSRKRRLAETLKKREATDTAGGSASPNPPGAM